MKTKFANKGNCILNWSLLHVFYLFTQDSISSLSITF